MITITPVDFKKKKKAARKSYLLTDNAAGNL